MAISKESWDKAQGYYEAGLTLRDIERRTGINNSTISKKAKSQQWRHGCNIDYIKAKETIAVKKSAINQQAIICADEIAEDNIRYKKLINDNATKLANKLNIMTDMVDTAPDLKSLVDSNDKLAITLKVADRHANSQVTVNNTNAQQNNDNNSILIAEALKAKYADK